MSFCHPAHHHCEPRFDLGKYFLSRLMSYVLPTNPFNRCCYTLFTPYNSVFGPPPSYDYTFATSPYKYVDTFQLMRNSQLEAPTISYTNSINNTVGLDTFSSSIAQYNNTPIVYQPPSYEYTFSSGNFIKQALSKSYSSNNTGNIDNSYKNLNILDAENKAKSDTRLECLRSGGNRWSISIESFITDIPYAKKGTGDILTKVAEEINQDLVITSALGTGAPNNPHGKDGYKSHHNATNPKLDIRVPVGMSAEEFAQKLDNTGYFSHVLPEGDHVDVQIDINKFETA